MKLLMCWSTRRSRSVVSVSCSVSRAGYIEAPDAFMERINPYPEEQS